MRVIENEFVPLSDGVRLAARIWLPDEADERPVPALLEYIPYRKRDKTRARDDRNHGWLAGRGYACLRVDIRGSGDSGGVLEDQFLARERDDALKVIEWIASRPWCDGNVGMFGLSWGGFAALQAAARRPPALKAVVGVCATDDTYTDNLHYMGGCLLSDNLSGATTMIGFTSSPPDPDVVGDRWRALWLERLRGSGHWLEPWLRHARRDDYWRPGSVREDAAAIRCPVMLVSGWADGYTNAVFRLLEALDVPRIGLVGPWSHTYPHFGKPGPAIDFLGEMVRFFDRWLKGERNGVMNGPMLRCWMQESVPPMATYDVRPGRWVAEESWPPADAAPRRLALAPGRLVAANAAAGADAALSIRSPLSVGQFAGKWCSYQAPPDLPGDQREEDGGSLVFEGDPLPGRLEILGRPVARLSLAADRPVAMAAVRLSDVRPDGAATRVTFGLLNLTHRDGHARPEPLTPGRHYEVEIPLNAVAHAFPAGHRLRLSISTTYWPLAFPPPEPVTLTVRTGGSSLLLPERTPRAADDAVAVPETPRFAPTGPLERIEPPAAEWIVTRDLARDRTVLTVVKDEGRIRYGEIDLVVRRRTVERYSSRGNDPLTVRGETETIREFARGDWRARADSRTILTAGRESFRLRAELDAREGGTRIHAESLDRMVPRDLV